MKHTTFEWDTQKNHSNVKKHGVSFDEAKAVFYDQHALLISDPDHSADEDRFILLGVSHSFRVLLVCHCYRKQDAVIRIISARKATKEEQRHYQEKL
jgi:hypothetical protein